MQSPRTSVAAIKSYSEINMITIYWPINFLKTNSIAVFFEKISTTSLVQFPNHYLKLLTFENKHLTITIKIVMKPSLTKYLTFHAFLCPLKFRILQQAKKQFLCQN